VGIPSWSVNLFSLNLMVRDTPAFYTPGRGPQISWDLTYNSLNDVPGATSPFYVLGNAVSCNYLAHVVDLGGVVHVVMPDGREDWYFTSDPGALSVVYTPAPTTGVFNTLTKANNHTEGIAVGFKLVMKDHSVLNFFQPVTAGGVTYYALTQVTDPLGASVTLGYINQLVAPQLSTLTDASGGVSQVAYSGGLISQVTDPFGGKVQFSYSGNHLTAITDQAGYTTLLGYGAGGLTSITNPLTVPDPTWQIAYVNGQVSSITGPDGHVRRYVAGTNTTTLTDELGRSTIYSFSNNSFGGAGQVTGPVGNSSQQTFDADRNPTRVIDPRGYFTDSTYDTRGNILTERRYQNPYPDATKYIGRSWT